MKHSKPDFSKVQVSVYCRMPENATNHVAAWDIKRHNRRSINYSAWTHKVINRVYRLIKDSYSLDPLSEFRYDIFYKNVLWYLDSSIGALSGWNLNHSDDNMWQSYNQFSIFEYKIAINEYLNIIDTDAWVNKFHENGSKMTNEFTFDQKAALLLIMDIYTTGKLYTNNRYSSLEILGDAEWDDMAEANMLYVNTTDNFKLWAEFGDATNSPATLEAVGLTLFKRARFYPEGVRKPYDKGMASFFNCYR